MSTSINLDAWYESLKEKWWWDDLHPDHAILLYLYAQKAYNEKLKYYVRDPIGGEVELTKFYEQFKLLQILKDNHR